MRAAFPILYTVFVRICSKIFEGFRPTLSRLPVCFTGKMRQLSVCYLTAFHRLSDVSKPYYPLYAAEYARLFPCLSGDFSRSFRCLSVVSLRSLIPLFNHFHGLSGLLRGYRTLFAFFSDVSDDIFPILSAFLEES